MGAENPKEKWVVFFSHVISTWQATALQCQPYFTHPIHAPNNGHTSKACVSRMGKGGDTTFLDSCGRIFPWTIFQNGKMFRNMKS